MNEIPVIEVNPGRYPVDISVVHWDLSDDPMTPAPVRRVAATVILLKDGDVSTWEFAFGHGNDLEENEILGFGVDSGKGCFIDALGLRFLMRLQQEGDQFDEIAETVMRDQFATLEEPHLGVNAIFFDCGMGDGFYPVWLGRNTHGDPVRVVADLELLDQSLGVAGG